ncbi:aminotransferase class I/II-fold pyridoxal phosphate-dependent enzyme [Svornostia abyssi]|uniref:Aminotransferase class I/II-fold pyridoxal phosphate-dependent enzyme n=1 Tax=Svornostia abyssi TaxID=2898438 RepID=A0ABY5PCI6_9ACTN|nr:aminotransferase class I/II-fold pyridoxal phosphate-dependent enzyme [Parviterribacteraceae bacterium J379]
MTDIQRGGSRSVTQQIIDVITAAIASGELKPGDRLPATREIAELVGVNHLTAVRAYRRMREHGQVTARVGAGTFVRDPRAVNAADDELEWQRYVLPPATPSHHSRASSTGHDQAVDEGTVPLSVGYPPTRMLPDALWARHTADALADLGPVALQYGPIEGVPALREQLAAQHDEVLDDVLVVNGAMQGLSLAARVLIRPGEAVAVESPTFMGTIEVLRQAGARIVPIPVDEHGLDVDELARVAVREDLRAVFIQARLQNPTGADLAPERAERLLELARRHAFFVVDDEVWAELRFSGEDPGPLRRLAPAHVIAIGSFSKTLGGGLRLGWMRASGGMIDRLALAKHNDDLHSPHARPARRRATPVGGRLRRPPHAHPRRVRARPRPHARSARPAPASGRAMDRADRRLMRARHAGRRSRRPRAPGRSRPRRRVDRPRQRADRRAAQRHNAATRLRLRGAGGDRTRGPAPRAGDQGGERGTPRPAGVPPSADLSDGAGRRGWEPRARAAPSR